MADERTQPTITMNESTHKSQEAMNQEAQHALSQLLTELQQIDSQQYRGYLRYLRYALTTLGTTGFGINAN
jgi:hypothetical protein